MVLIQPVNMGGNLWGVGGMEGRWNEPRPSQKSLKTGGSLSISLCQRKRHSARADGTQAGVG